MLPVVAAEGAAEALVLGIATGPVCFASCGPVVLPWMAVQPRGLRIHTAQLGAFLAARFAAYLLFAAAVWVIGEGFPHSWIGNSVVAGGVRLCIAAALLVHAAGLPRARCLASTRPHGLVQIGEAQRQDVAGALSLGFLTGISLCPPFLVAGLRAAQLGSLAGSLLFFTLFFLGTSAWFVPLLLMGLLRRTDKFMTLARITAALLAGWYLISGIVLLSERVVYG